MLTIRQAVMPADRGPVQVRFSEYLRLVCPRIYEEYRAVFDLRRDFSTLDRCSDRRYIVRILTYLRDRRCLRQV